MEKKAIHNRILIMIPLLFLCLFSYGCSENHPREGYIEAVVPHVGVSFCYPESFVDRGGYLQEDSLSPQDIRLLRSPPNPRPLEQEMVIAVINWGHDRNPESSLYTCIYNTKYVFEYGEVTFLEESSIYPPVPSWDEFILLERPVRKVAGIEAEYLVYSASDLYQILGVVEPAIVRTVLFEHDESVWEISLISFRELADEAEEIFDILLDSFKFLD